VVFVAVESLSYDVAQKQLALSPEKFESSLEAVPPARPDPHYTVEQAE